MGGGGTHEGESQREREGISLSKPGGQPLGVFLGGVLKKGAIRRTASGFPSIGEGATARGPCNGCFGLFHMEEGPKKEKDS